MHFLWLILLASLPGVGLTFYVGFERRQQAIAEAQKELLQLAHLTTSHHVRLLEVERQLLTTISDLPEVLDGTPSACQRRFAELLQQYPHYTNLAVVTPGGETYCSGLPFTPPVKTTQRLWFRQAVQTKNFAVGEYQVGTITGKQTLNLALPILGPAHQIRALVVAALDLGRLNQLLAATQLPRGSTLSLIDVNGTVVAHHPEPQRWVGQLLPGEAMIRTVLNNGEGTADLPDLDGIGRLFAFKPVVVSGQQPAMYVLAGMAKAKVIARANWGFVQSLMVWGAVTLLGMAAAWGGSDWLIVRRLKSMVRTAEQVASGDLGARTGIAHGRSELVQLARAFDDMAEALETRQTEAVQAQEALQRAFERLNLLHQIDRALVAQEEPEAIAAAVLPPLRDLLGVPRAIINLFDLAAGEVEWLAAVGRRRLRLGPGVRYSMHLMGDVEALQRGESQVIDVDTLPPSPEREALLASGVHVYMVIPMIAAGELIGGLSFGGLPGPFPAEQVSIAREAAMQLAIAISQARLHERVKRHAEELEQRVQERTQALSTAQAELQHTNAELLQLTSALQVANQELEAFSSSVSHDLRAPLRSIDGFSQALLEDYGQTLDPHAQDYLQRIRAANQRMSELIDALLTLARVSRTDMQRLPIDLSAIATASIAELQRHEPQRRVEVVIAPDLRATGDERLLRVVLDNLLGNAWKFSAKQSPSRLEFGAQTAGTEPAVFFVRDNGAGFDMAYADRLFGAFQRLHRSSDFPGTGIGLATVQRIIHRHGGRIWAEGQVGQGATFYFTLEGASQQ